MMSHDDFEKRLKLVEERIINLETYKGFFSANYKIHDQMELLEARLNEIQQHHGERNLANKGDIISLNQCYLEHDKSIVRLFEEVRDIRELRYANHQQIGCIEARMDDFQKRIIILENFVSQNYADDRERQIDRNVRDNKRIKDLEDFRKEVLDWMQDKQNFIKNIDNCNGSIERRIEKLEQLNQQFFDANPIKAMLCKTCNNTGSFYIDSKKYYCQQCNAKDI
jgi:hypothetical protein